ncbi:DoxX family protein [Nocardioides montaniterrae]
MKRWTALLLGTTRGGTAVDLAVLVMRLVLAWIFVYYGASKLFGAFPGTGGTHGLHQTARFMAQGAHLHPGELFAVMAGSIELGGGIAMALGLLTRLAGLALVGDMVMAVLTVTGSEGLDPTTGTGYQLNLAVAAAALAVTLIGAGRFSLDAQIVRIRSGSAGTTT